MGLETYKLPPSPEPMPAVNQHSVIVFDDLGTSTSMQIRLNRTGEDAVEWITDPLLGTTDQYKFFIDDTLEDAIGFNIPSLGVGAETNQSSLLQEYDITFTAYGGTPPTPNGFTLDVDDNGNNYLALNATREFDQSRGLTDYNIGTFEKVHNGTFSSGFDGWEAVSASWNVVSNTMRGVSGLFQPVLGTLRQFISVQPNTQYTITFDISQISGSTNTCNCGVLLSESTYVSGQEEVTVSDGAGSYSVVYETGSDTSEVNLILFIGKPNTGEDVTAFFDNISIEVTGDKFLTNAPRTQDIRLGEDYFLPAFTRGSYNGALGIDGTADLRITKTNKNGTTDFHNQPVPNFNTNKRVDFGVGPNNIDQYNNGFIDCSVKSYEVQLYLSDTAISEAMTFELQHNAPDGLRCYFLNSYGGYDAFTFDLSRSTRVKAETRQYEKLLPEVPNSKSRGITDLQRRGFKSVVAYSDVVMSEVGDWLEELYTSPDVYIVLEGSYVPVTVKPLTVTTSTTTPNYTRATVEFEYSNNTTRQRS